MSYSVTKTAEGKYLITHATRPLIGDWTYDTEAVAHAVLREMALDSAWARHEAAKADLAWDRFEQEYGDD
jgi:hypothetical protein